MPVASYIFGIPTFRIICLKAEIAYLVAFTLALDYFLFADNLSRTAGPFGFFLGMPLVWQSIHLTK